MKTILTTERLHQIDSLIEHVRTDPMFITNLIDAASRGEDVENFAWVTVEMECCPMYMNHVIESATFTDYVLEHGGSRKLELMKHASLDDLLDARQRIMAGREAVAA